MHKCAQQIFNCDSKGPDEYDGAQRPDKYGKIAFNSKLEIRPGFKKLEICSVGD